MMNPADASIAADSSENLPAQLQISTLWAARRELEFRIRAAANLPP
jgi:hypothetical protein